MWLFNRSARVQSIARKSTERRRLNLESLESRDNPSTLTPGDISPVSTISQAGETDTWTFTGNSGDIVELITTSTPSQAGFNAYTTVRAPSGNTIRQYWPNDNQRFTLLETGTFEVLVRDDDFVQTGSYTIGFETLKPISPDSQPLLLGGIRGGQISSATEKDQWTFTGAQGQLIELITTSTATQAGFNAYTEVVAPSGTIVRGFWPGDNQRFRLEETGTYMLLIRDSRYAATGTYTIGLESLNPISPSPTPAVFGGVRAGTISAGIEKDQWTFTGTRGQIIELITTSTPIQAGFNAYAEVVAPSGTIVRGFWAGDNQRFALEESGQYMIQIRDSRYAAKGSYTIGLESVKPASPAGVPLTVGGIRAGAITFRTEKDQWLFSGKAGQTVELITTSTAQQAGFAAYTEVFAPSGTVIAQFWALDNIRLSLEETGTYIVQIRDSRFAALGRYTIGLESFRPTSPDAVYLPPNTLHAGTINQMTEKDTFVVNVPAGRRLRITLTTTARYTAGFTPYARVFNAAGASEGGMWPGAQTFTVSQGWHVIQISDANLWRRGAYRIWIAFV